jgi:L-asparaginase
MSSILVIDTGGTFNKRYDPKSGELMVDGTSQALRDITSKWLYDLKYISIIGKDSLEMDDRDRALLTETIRASAKNKIIVVHGTDTMDQSAEAIAGTKIAKQIVLTGAMVPYSVDPVEAAANLTSAFGFLVSCTKDGVYIAMNGVIEEYQKVIKDRIMGKFILSHTR